MKLSDAERWILMNQYEILGLLDPQSKARYDRAIEAIQEGYEEDHHEFIVMASQKDFITSTERRLVLDSMTLHRHMLFSYDALPDKTGIGRKDIEFAGFDGNDEPNLYGYSSWFLSMGRFEEFKAPHGVNSHTPMAAKYQAMLAAWRSMGKPTELTREQLLTLVKIKHPYR